MEEMNLIYIWDSLELAKNKLHPYGGDIVEVYQGRLGPIDKSGKILYALLYAFAHYHNVQITINGKEFGPWLKDYIVLDKCDVRVIKSYKYLSKDQAEKISEKLKKCKIQKNSTEKQSKKSQRNHSPRTSSRRNKKVAL